MASKTSKGEVRLSILDRLLQADGESWEVVGGGESVQRQKRAVQRDLEWLLNTRRVAEPAPEGLMELHASVYHYGLEDITSLSGDSPTVRRELAMHVRDVIEQFEPRLMDVRVEVQDAEEQGGRRIRFVIDAFLRMDPSPERVVFDTVLETTSGRFLVSGRSHA